MESFVLVIFGITSNLAKLKLIPALYDLFEHRMVPEDITIIGIARHPKKHEEFGQYIQTVLHTENRHHQHPIDPQVAELMISKMHYLAGDVDNAETYQHLISQLGSLEKEGAACQNRIFYLATYPDLYQTIFEQLQQHELNKQVHGWVRLMVEKPIGNDRESAQRLNDILGNYYEEDQIYRLDHYLGKETLQNIMTFRFANGIFEPLLNDQYVDHVEITAAEDFGIGDRGAYYDKVGALKDVGQNHLLQMAAFALMDRPNQLDNKDITAKRIQLLRQLTPVTDSAIFGQYDEYHQEKSVGELSEADTFFAFKLSLTNERFHNLPIYIRGGKKLAQTVTEVAIVFKKQPDSLYRSIPQSESANVLIYRIQPNEGIVMRILTKSPGAEIGLEETYMQYCYRFTHDMVPDPYERLIIDAFHGNQTYFVDAEEVDAQWELTDPLSAMKQTLHPYSAGSWGPKAADEMIAKDGRMWLEPSLAFCAL